MKNTSLLLFAIFLFNAASGQRAIENSADLLQEIKKLNVLCNVMYLAAHPDDENTRLIAWLENEKLTRTAYLSLTRGDGGQNLIGTEKGDAMGVLRTQELREARKIDGAEQFFSRAVDFGYSKTADETFEKWGKEEVLEDVVYTIRKFRPDVIITRFPPDKRAGHGHHTASAVLAEEAFSSSADPSSFSKQFQEVEGLEAWQAKRILWNTSVWWDQQLPEKAANAEDYILVDIGTYNPVLGLSYSEIAADSRSQHRSQGFGSARTRGTKLEYLKHTAGEEAKKDLFDGIDITWNRVDGSEKIQEMINKIIADFSQENPENIVPQLLSLYQEMEMKADNFYVKQKMAELSNILQAATGLHLVILADEHNYALQPDSFITGNIMAINRSDIDIQIQKISPQPNEEFISIGLKNNEINKIPFKTKIKGPISQPYWLNNSYEDISLSSVGSKQFGLPENKKPVNFDLSLSFNGVPVQMNVPVHFQWTDRAKGELQRNLVVSPSLTTTPTEKIILFQNEDSHEVKVLVESNQSSFKGVLSIDCPANWKLEPQEIDMDFKKKGELQSFTFKITPPETANTAKAKITIDGKSSHAVQRIEYDHVWPQILFPEAEIKLVKLDLVNQVKRLAYIKGSGDEVAKNLRQVGYLVDEMEAKDLALADLTPYETILVGIRAYNTENSLSNGNVVLNEFVKNGGNVIVQYNTNRGLKSEEIGPYPFKISRKRVTKEEAAVKFIDPKNSFFHSPNQLSQADFDNWVQERGLYFANEWDEAFQPVLEWNDPGEDPQQGAVLIAKYGEGHFMYTGISFFRQLPAGVPGAYRILANLIAYGK